MAVPVAVTQEVGTGAVSVIALKLAKPAVASWAGGGLVRTVSAVPLAVTLPPYRNTPMRVQSKRHDAQCSEKNSCTSSNQMSIPGVSLNVSLKI